MSALKIAIIGAGPAALTLARLLQYNSIPCTIFERESDRYARTQGGTLDLHESSAQLALREAGLYDQFLKLARPEGEVLKIIDASGKVLLDESENLGVGRPEQMKNRPEIDRVLLRGILLDSIDAASVRWGCKLQRVEAAANDTHDLFFADGVVESGFDLVVGADGAWSKVRPLVSNTVPFYSGVTGLDVLVSDADHRHPALAKRVGGGMCLNLGENQGILAQRNGNGNIRVYAFLRVSETWYKDCGIDWTLSEPAKRELIDGYFENWDQGAKDLILKADPEVIPRPMYMLPVGFQWAPRPGITLIGDAAHLMTPFAGVGVNVGMQDALELAHVIISRKSSWDSSALFSDKMTLAAALKEYETAMFVRAEENAKATSMYLDLFFNERGAVKMVEHFEQIKVQEKAAAEVKATA